MISVIKILVYVPHSYILCRKMSCKKFKIQNLNLDKKIDELATKTDERFDNLEKNVEKLCKA